MLQNLWFRVNFKMGGRNHKPASKERTRICHTVAEVFNCKKRIGLRRGEEERLGQLAQRVTQFE